MARTRPWEVSDELWERVYPLPTLVERIVSNIKKVLEAQPQAE